ncbi:conserved hypothetical protein [Luminiphilus syltensis NOR5-1B]|uniref:VWA domain-containing protein n=1 Tax=Luminiphilus syltensis NOR5-1B TaxID=565045 RepID=B8KQL1_9GAMM|nr:hypothetical protein [Luminiphilus syltensis]EED36937.1 conserved hypothetical protein [Luminiphilus syltensis NOR5-1B]
MSKSLTTNPSSDVSAFLKKSKAIRRVVERQSRLMFALDATASREPTWERARALHNELFTAAVTGSSLALQLAYYRGFNEFVASPWLTAASELQAHMSAVACQGGPTQIGRVLRHYLATSTPATPVRALVFIGDAMEESAKELCQLAAQCGVRKQPVFLFQEGHDNNVAGVFEQMAKNSGGAYAQFDANSAERLRSLLEAVVRFTSGGHKALTSSGTEAGKLLLSQLPRRD